ncbi:MAG: hypothetical protein WC341_09365 [Bacteroidales bacterium]|jgi:hypothetical protein
MARVLVVTYTQSGQSEEIVTQVLAALRGQVELVVEPLKPIPDYPFPWTGIDFYDAMPESVEMIPSKLAPFQFNTDDHYDLIILGYPIWFLSPPIPITTFLKSKEAAKVMKNTPVLTVIGCRNMWVNAQEDIKRMVAENEGKLVGNISLRDRHNNLLSVVTIIYWMGTGKKERYLGLFPKPGVSDEDIADAVKFGTPILQAIKSGDFNGLQEKLIALKAVELDPNVVSTENKGKKIFKIWSKFVLKKGKSGDPSRITRLNLFKYYLLFVIFIVSPLVSLVFYLTYPLFYRRIKSKIKYYQSVSLK